MKIYLTESRYHSYEEALTALGVQVSYTDPEECGALLLPGGGDVHPRRYGQPLAGSEGIDEEKDARELAAVDAFVRRGLPILGICRGCQVLNVAFGGTLFQDIPGHSRSGDEDTLHGSRTVDEMLLGIYGERFIINSSHHQAVDRLGRGLRAVQWADDGTVEAIRHEALPVFGVQWHPERLRTPTDGWKLLERWLADCGGSTR